MAQPEHAVASCQAVVLTYNKDAAKWVPSGPGNGLSRVHLYKHEENMTYRVVGRNLQSREVNINSMFSKTTTYHLATKMFHQWRDRHHVYGLNFSNATEAETFSSAAQAAVINLKGIASGTISAASPRPKSSSPQHQIPDAETRRQSLERPMSTTSSLRDQSNPPELQTVSPGGQRSAPPPTPTNPTTSAVTSAPPPPPPPPSNTNNGGTGADVSAPKQKLSFLDEIAGAKKLRKIKPPAENAVAPKGAPKLSLQDEMAAKLQKRQNLEKAAAVKAQEKKVTQEKEKEKEKEKVSPPVKKKAPPPVAAKKEQAVFKIPPPVTIKRPSAQSKFTRAVTEPATTKAGQRKQDESATAPDVISTSTATPPRSPSRSPTPSPSPIPAPTPAPTTQTPTPTQASPPPSPLPSTTTTTSSSPTIQLTRGEFDSMKSQLMEKVRTQVAEFTKQLLEGVEKELEIFRPEFSI